MHFTKDTMFFSGILMRPMFRYASHVLWLQQAKINVACKMADARTCVYPMSMRTRAHVQLDLCCLKMINSVQKVRCLVDLKILWHLH